MKAYIFCSSKEDNYEYLKKEDFANSVIICADGGAKIAKKIGLKADLYVGDMDSSNGEFSAKERVLLPAEKDFSDSEAAANAAVERGADEIIFIGATKGRLDHEYANYCVLKQLLKRGIFGKIIDEKNTVFMMNKSGKIYPEDKKYISFFPFSEDVKNFSLKNVKYELDCHTLKNDCSFTVSNEFINSSPAEIRFSGGYVLVICSND